MTDPQRSSTDRKVSIATIEKQLIELRKRGMNNPVVSDLTELVRLAEALIPEGAVEVGVDGGARYWEDNDDPTVRRVEVLLECTLDPDNGKDWLADPRHSQAVRLWFGLDPKTRKLGQEERHEQARLSLGRPIVSGTWKNHYATKIKRELTTRLRTRFKANEPFTPDEAIRRLPKASSPAAEGVGADFSVEPEIGRSAQRGRTLTRNRVLLFAAVVVVAAAALAIALGTFSSPRQSLIPPKGTIINATTGKVDLRPDRQPPHGEVDLIGGGPIFRACNFTQDPECNFREGRFHVSLGDRLRFVFVLENEGKTPLPYGRFSVNFQSGFGLNPDEARAAFFISWPGGRDEEEHLTTKKGDATFVSGGAPIDIRYLPGSTELLPLNPQHRLTYLPDGIASLYGIGLTHIGPPSSCFINCTGRFIRFIEFEAEVVK